MRFAIWTAVSTTGQAGEDKDSLPEQEKKCRAVGLSRGWVETRVYSAPGRSRTRYVNLRDAEKDIPDLAALLDDAQTGKFEVVVVYDYNRLRDLADPIAKALSAYGVQLFSANQPIEPLDPETFNPYASDSESMMRGLNTIISRHQISDLRRKHAFGTLGRLKRGLHPGGKAPFGYRLEHPDPKKGGILVVNPSEAQLAIQIKDLYLSGLSVPQIIARFDSERVRIPSEYGIRFMLQNPLYAGVNRMGYFKSISDPRTGARKEVRGDKVLTEKGNHQSLWDMPTHRALVAEFKRRAKRHKGPRTQRLSGLLFCEEHERVLYVAYGPHRDEAHRFWRCPLSHGVCVKDREALDFVVSEILDRRAWQEPEAQMVDASSAISDLGQRRKRWDQAYEDGALDMRTYKERVSSIDAQLADLQARERRAEQSKADLEAAKKSISVLQAVPAYLREADAQQVNAILRRLIERVKCGDQLAVVWRA